MTKEEIIVSLTKENMELNERLQLAVEVAEDIELSLIAVGAPLNDNVLKCNSAQLSFLRTILASVRCILDE